MAFSSAINSTGVTSNNSSGWASSGISIKGIKDSVNSKNPPATDDSGDSANDGGSDSGDGTTDQAQGNSALARAKQKDANNAARNAVRDAAKNNPDTNPGSKSGVATKEEEKAAADADGDGVPDTIDRGNASTTSPVANSALNPYNSPYGYPGEANGFGQFGQLFNGLGGIGGFRGGAGGSCGGCGTGAHGQIGQNGSFAGAVQDPNRMESGFRENHYNEFSFGSVYFNQELNGSEPGKVFKENTQALRDQGFEEIAQSLDRLNDSFGKFHAHFKVAERSHPADHNVDPKIYNSSEFKEFSLAMQEADHLLRQSGLTNPDGRALNIMDVASNANLFTQASSYNGHQAMPNVDLQNNDQGVHFSSGFDAIQAKVDNLEINIGDSDIEADDYDQSTSSADAFQDFELALEENNDYDYDEELV